MDSSYEIVGKKNTQSLLINTPTHLHFSFNFWYTGKSDKLTMLYRKICFSAHLTTAIKYLTFLVFHFFNLSLNFMKNIIFGIYLLGFH